MRGDTGQDNSFSLSLVVSPVTGARQLGSKEKLVPPLASGQSPEPFTLA